MEIRGSLVPLPNNALLFDLLTMIIFADTAPIENLTDADKEEPINAEVEEIPRVPLYRTISVSIDNELAQIDLGKPFNIQAIPVVDKGKSVSKGKEFHIADKLDDTEQGFHLHLNVLNSRIVFHRLILYKLGRMQE